MQTVRLRRASALTLVGAVLLSACAPGAGAARDEAAARAVPAPTTPSFEPAAAEDDVPSDPAPTGPTPAAPEPDPSDDEPAASRDDPGSEGSEGPRGEDAEHAAPDDPDDPPVDGEAVTEAPTVATTSSVTDPAGDTSRPVLGRAPAAADLLGGAVRTTDGGFSVTFELAAAPESDRDTTLNLASFHDLTGDGRVDLEVWANHSEAGWFPSWRDNREGRAAYGRRSGLGVEADGRRLTLTVPASLLGGATSWRWALALEWGRYEWLGTEAAARDQAPDQGAVDHPA